MPAETVPENLTLAGMADLVRINLNREPNPTDTPQLNLISDIKTKIRARYYEIWDTRNWPETLKFGVVDTVDADQTEIEMPDDLSLITKVYITGTTTLLEAVDQDKLRLSPYNYATLGVHGIILGQSFGAETSLTFDGKECYPGLPSDASVPCIPCQLMLVDIVTSDFLSIDETDDARAAKWANDANVKWDKLVSKYESRMANDKRVAPRNPHTDLRQFGGYIASNTSRTGV